MIPPRPYKSAARDAASAQTRRRLLDAASEVLNEASSLKEVSLEAVARKAGVTRLTVYNQFGSRLGLMEAVFDLRAEQGGLFRLMQVFATPDAHAALEQVVAIFCDFWSSAPPMLARLHGAGEVDPELGAAIRARNERRRRGLATLVGRLADAGEVAAGRQADLVDLLFALTGFAFFDELRHGGRSPAAICELVRAQVRAAVAAAG